MDGPLKVDILGMETKPQQDDRPPVIIPAISPEEAEKIISHLNQQFEEKVLKKLKRPAIPPAEPSSSGQAVGDGRNLQEYLTSVLRERPKLPFLDEDSHMDLSKPR